MANSILTPVTLWQDFDESLPPNETVLSEEIGESVSHKRVRFDGRNTGSGAGRVHIYAEYDTPVGLETYPAILVLFEAGKPFDPRFISRYTEKGYAVLSVDYSGRRPDGDYTVYPKIVDYADYANVGRHMDYCDKTAKETSWYEWAAVARYAVAYLRSKAEVTRIGAIGLRTGGEILFKIAPYARLSCMVSVCAAGWLAYRGIGKFGDGGKQVLDEERHRFIAGIDSQSYAPHVKCPVLLVSAVNDRKYNFDRVYDTFRQINPEVKKAILFSAHGSGLVGTHSLADIDLFLDRYLKGRTVFLSDPVSVSVEEDEVGNLTVKGTFDPAGEIKDFGIFFTENLSDFKTREWTRVMGKPEDLDGNAGTVPLPLYAGSSKALVYAFVDYSNNFSVTSKILEVNVTKKYKNSCPRSRVIYDESDDRNGFSAFRGLENAVAHCFSDGSTNIRRHAGFGGIKGLGIKPGVISYRVGEPRYAAPEGASFRFDAYCPRKGRLRVVFFKDEEERAGFSEEVVVEGAGKWKSLIFDADDFKSENGVPLGDFSEAVAVAFLSEDDVLVNNILWI